MAARAPDVVIAGLGTRPARSERQAAGLLRHARDVAFQRPVIAAAG
jgi:hypothetical protein